MGRYGTVQAANIDGHVLDVNTSDYGNGVTYYYYINFANEDRRYLSLLFTISNTTITLEGSNDDPGTADASASWTDITSAMTGSANATASGGWIFDTPLPVKRVRVKAVTTDASNTLDLYLTRTA